jgi:hypothetical protein
LPHLQDMFIEEKLDLESVFKIRHLSSAKYFRKWINQVSADEDAKPISDEYLNEIKGSS